MAGLRGGGGTGGKRTPLTTLDLDYPPPYHWVNMINRVTSHRLSNTNSWQIPIDVHFKLNPNELVHGACAVTHTFSKKMSILFRQRNGLGKISGYQYRVFSCIAVRRVWKTYFPVADGILYIIDASDRDRFLESKAELDVSII